jgi:hypothetical protein
MQYVLCQICIGTLVTTCSLKVFLYANFPCLSLESMIKWRDVGDMLVNLDLCCHPLKDALLVLVALLLFISKKVDDGDRLHPQWLFNSIFSCY